MARTAGRDGAVSAHFYTKQAFIDPRAMPSSTVHIARADCDYRTASGRIEWADGEESWQLLSIDILDDFDEEIREIFLVEFDDVQVERSSTAPVSLSSALTMMTVSPSTTMTVGRRQTSHRRAAAARFRGRHNWRF